MVSKYIYLIKEIVSDLLAKELTKLFSFARFFSAVVSSTTGFTSSLQKKEQLLKIIQDQLNYIKLEIKTFALVIQFEM